MRNAPVPCLFAEVPIKDCMKKLMMYSEEQSFSTHQGIEASDCSKLLSYICHQAMQFDLDEEIQEYRGRKCLD